MGLFDKGVQKTKEGFFQRLSRAVVGKSKVDDDVLDALEEALLSSDMGVDTTLKVIENLEDRVCGVQFHLESAPGPLDNVNLFDKFIQMMEDPKNA